jgi:hypothetical protein
MSDTDYLEFVENKRLEAERVDRGRLLICMDETLELKPQSK